MPENEIAVVDPKAIVEVAKAEARAAHQGALQTAMVLHASGLYPRFKSPVECAAALVAGEQLGLGPHAALTRLYVVQGQISLQGEAMLALVYASGKVRVSFPERSTERVICRMDRIDGTGTCEVVWDATRAKATGNYDKHKGHLLEWMTWRAVAECARIACPDVIAGVYTDDELRDAEAVVPKPTALERARTAKLPGRAPEPEVEATVTPCIGEAGAKLVEKSIAEIGAKHGLNLTEAAEDLRDQLGFARYSDMTQEEAEELIDRLHVVAAERAEARTATAPSADDVFDDVFDGE